MTQASFINIHNFIKFKKRKKVLWYTSFHNKHNFIKEMKTQASFMQQT